MNQPGVAGTPAVAGVNNALNVPDEPSQKYKEQALYLLKKEFPLLSVQAINQVFQQYHYNFARSFEALKTIRMHLDNEGGLDIVRQQYACLQRVNKLKIQKARQNKHTRITDESLLEELDHIPEFNRKENAATGGTKKPEIIVIDDDDAGPIENKEFGLECACCFSECPIETMVQCTEAHLFCLDCLS